MKYDACEVGLVLHCEVVVYQIHVQIREKTCLVSEVLAVLEWSAMPRALDRGGPGWLMAAHHTHVQAHCGLLIRSQHMLEMSKKRYDHCPCGKWFDGCRSLRMLRVNIRSMID